LQLFSCFHFSLLFGYRIALVTEQSKMLSFPNALGKNSNTGRAKKASLDRSPLNYPIDVNAKI
jgi:hypothetical protein